MLSLILMAALLFVAALGCRKLLQPPNRIVVISGTRFSRPMEVALLLPELMSLACILVASAVRVPEASLWLAVLIFASLLFGLVPFFVFPLALTFLMRMPSLRTARNVLLTSAS